MLTHDIHTAFHARERVLDVAERLFAQRGYTAVTLRDIAAELGMRHASLYYHVPGGKEALFEEVTTRTLTRHANGIEQALTTAPPILEAQLLALTDWLVTQPPMDLLRMSFSDLPAISPERAARLSELAYQALIKPVEEVLRQAHQRGEVADHNLPMVAGLLLGTIQSLFAAPANLVGDPAQLRAMAHEAVRVLLVGLLPRQ